MPPSSRKAPAPGQATRLTGFSGPLARHTCHSAVVHRTTQADPGDIATNRFATVADELFVDILTLPMLHMLA